MANSEVVFPCWGSQFQVYWMLLQVKTNCGLHSAAKGMEKTVLAMSVCGTTLLPWIPVHTEVPAQQQSEVV